MILLNAAGRVAESTGACVIMVRDGVIAIPPASEGALESITVDIVEALALSEGIEVQRRPIERTELLIADEIALAGTLAEITPVNRVDEFTLPTESPIVSLLQKRYFEAVRGSRPHTAVDMTPVPGLGLIEDQLGEP